MPHSASWTPDSPVSPLHRQAHYQCSIGRYIVSMCGYISLGQDHVEFLHPYIHFLDCFTGAEFTHLCRRALALTSPSLQPDDFINPFSLSSPAGCCVQECHVYLFGGFSKERQSSINTLFHVDFTDPLSPSYRVLVGSRPSDPEQRMPVPRDKATLVYWQGKLYAFGGYGLNPEALQNSHSTEYFLEGMNFQSCDGLCGWNNQLLVFNLDTQSWSLPSPQGTLPSPRAAHAAVVVDCVMFVFGGRVASSSAMNPVLRVNDLFSLHLPSLQWTQVRLEGQVPCGRSWMSLTPTASEDALIVFGGQTSQDVSLSDLHMIELPLSTWKNTWRPLSSAKCCQISYECPQHNEADSNSVCEQPEHLNRLWHGASLTYDGQLCLTGGVNISPTQQDEEDRHHWTEPPVLMLRVASPPSLMRLCFVKLLVTDFFWNHDPPAVLSVAWRLEWQRLQKLRGLEMGQVQEDLFMES